MMTQKQEHPYVEKRVKPGWYLYWKHQTYRIVSTESKDPLTLYAENTTTSEVRPFSFTELWLSESDDVSGPIFATTLEQLHREIDTRRPLPEIALTKGIPAQNIAKADYILSVVEQVRKLMPTAKELLIKERKEQGKNGEKARKETNTDVLKRACALLKPKAIGLSTFFKYEHCINTHDGDRSTIAAAF